MQKYIFMTLVIKGLKIQTLMEAFDRFNNITKTSI